MLWLGHRMSRRAFIELLKMAAGLAVVPRLGSRSAPSSSEMLRRQARQSPPRRLSAAPREAHR